MKEILDKLAGALAEGKDSGVYFDGKKKQISLDNKGY